MNTINKNLIPRSLLMLAIFIVFVSGFTLTTPAHATTFTVNSGATFTGNSSSTQTNQNTNGSINPIPIVYAVTPNYVTAISGNMAVILTGVNFVQGSMAQFNNNINNTYRPTTFTDSGRLTVILNASDLAKSGNYVISVFNPMPGGGTSNGVFFTVNVTPQVINSVSPATIAPPAPISTNTVSSKATAPKVATKTKSKVVTEIGNDLTASAIFASNGFLPTNIFQWILFAIMILLGVIFWRKLYVNEEKRKGAL